MKKAIILSPSIFPNLCGMSVAANYHAYSLSDLGYKVEIIGPIPNENENNKDYLFKNLGFNVSGGTHFYNKLKGDVKSVIRYIEKKEPELLLIEGWFSWGNSLILQHDFKCKIILFSHGTSQNYYNLFSPTLLIKSIFQRLTEKNIILKTIKVVDGFFVLWNNANNRRFNDLKLIRSNKKEIFCWPNQSKFSKKVEKSETKYLINVGKMDVNKNQRELIHLLSKLPTKYKLRLCYPSENKYSRDLKNLVEKKSLRHRVEFVVGKKPTDLEKYYLTSYCYTCVSRFEVQPITIVDSLKCGLPVISYDVGCVKNFTSVIISTKKEFVKNIISLNNKNKWEEVSRQNILFYKEHITLKRNDLRSFMTQL